MFRAGKKQAAAEGFFAPAEFGESCARTMDKGLFMTRCNGE